MIRKISASDFTHALAIIGGGSKKSGGGGMVAGIEIIFKTGVLVGNQFGLKGVDVTAMLDELFKHYIEKK